MMRSLNVALAICLMTGCGGGDGDPASPTPADLPLVTPPVEAATPEGFLTSAVELPHLLDSADIKTRFFVDGPTDIFFILDNVDGRISGFNSMSATMAIPCVTQEPVEYSITPFGDSISMFAQCYEPLPDDLDPNGFAQFGVKDGVTYLFQTRSSSVAAILTPDPSDPALHSVEIYMTVGDKPNIAAGSYGVIHVSADESVGEFEMAVAGNGFGYCGAQLRSDGAEVYAIGSVDMGTTCNAVDSLCVLASDVTTPVPAIRS